ncbi:MAG: hypothetical protein J7K87_01040 [Candidatus Aenigmarchaeota archaeon]|nr:hypothetical protein [Candidatus Aenigmarchaeota archaeon]
MLYITYSLLGIFALDQRKNIVEYSPFPKKPEKIIQRLEEVKRGEIVPELEKILGRIKDKNIVTNIPFKHNNFHIEYKEKISSIEFLKSRDTALKLGFVNSIEEFNKLLSDIQITRTKNEIKLMERRDRIAMQVVSAIDDLTDITNRLSERLHEWYGLYYPELERKIKDNKKYSERISENPIRDYEKTIGMEFEKGDIDAIEKFAKETKNIFGLKTVLEKYIDELMLSIAPNVTSITGSILGAKLILLAGGLEKLARLPSSTIQLLGAEKALFRFMKSKKKSRPPKYGVLFLHPEVTNAPPELKGKVARIIASLISKAAKTDFYAKEDRSEIYKREFERKMREIKEN